ncbi:MAG: hypothetical protein MUF34_03830 [Polyangiaceae bacterium]|nr:hypothetical protein [Polyangiaceae bacterium]
MTAPAARRRLPPAPAARGGGPSARTGARLAASRLVGVMLALAFGLVAGPARADDEANVRSGINSFEGGRYQECIERFEAMFAEDSPTFLRDQSAKDRARMYYASCLTARNRRGDAEEQLATLALEDPRYAPDSGAFPGPVIDKFYEIREKKKDEIRQRELALIAREQSEAKQRDEARQAEVRRRRQLIERAGEKFIVRQNSRLVAALPFGVGQFQNEQVALGWAFLGVESALAVASLTTYLVAANYEREVLTRPQSINIRETGELHADVAFANRLLFGGLLAVAAGGVVHAQLTYVPAVETKVRRDVPADLLIVPQLSLGPGGGAVLGLGGTF